MPTLLVVVALSLGAAASDPGEVAREILSDGYQTDLPGQGAEKVDDRYEQLEAKPRQTRRGNAGALGSVANALLWVGIAVVIIILVFALANHFSGYTQNAAAPDVAGEDDDDETGERRRIFDTTRQDAEELAGSGDYAAAIHALLLKSIDALISRVGKPLSPALTSREILANIPMPTPARNQMAGLVSAVEVSHFGDEVPGFPDYQRCKHHFEQFVSAYAGGAR